MLATVNGRDDAVHTVHQLRLTKRNRVHVSSKTEGDLASRREESEPNDPCAPLCLPPGTRPVDRRAGTTGGNRGLSHHRFMACSNGATKAFHSSIMPRSHGAAPRSCLLTRSIATDS